MGLTARTAAELVAMTNQQQLGLQLDLMFGHVDWPETVRIAFGGARPPRWTQVHPATPLDAIYATVQQTAEKAPAYVATAAKTFRAEGRPNAAGTKRDLYATITLVADIDSSRGVHAPDPRGLPLPTHEQALAIVHAHPLEPTFVVETGGGWQAAWVLTAPALLPGQIKAVESLMADHSAALRAASEALGLAYDASQAIITTANIRAVGTWNRKTRPEKAADTVPLDIFSQPVRITEASGQRYSLEELRAALPRRPKIAGKGGISSDPEHRCGQGANPTAMVCLTLPISRLMRELPEWDWANKENIPDAEDDVRLVYAHNPSNAFAHAKLYFQQSDEDNPNYPRVSRVAAFGTETAARLGIQAHAATCTWRWLVHARLAGNRAAAHALVEAFDGAPDALMQAILDYPDAVALISHTPARPVRQTALVQAIAELGGQHIRIDTDGIRTLYVIVGTSDHGTWERKSVWDADEDEMVVKIRKLWHGIMFRTAMTRYLDGTVEAVEPLHSASILLADGTAYTANRLLFEDATHPERVWSLTQAQIMKPTGPQLLADLASSLQILGSGEVTSSAIQTAMGWVQVNGRWAYNGYTAGVNARGSIAGGWAKAPTIVSMGRRTTVTEEPFGACELGTGWPDAPVDGDAIRAAARAISALIALTPKRFDLAVALLGAYFSAPLMLPEKVALPMVGAPGSAKTLLVSCYHSLVTSAGLGGRGLTVGLAGKFSIAGVEGVRRMHNDAVVVLDDGARNSDAAKNATAWAVIDNAIKDSYGQSSGAMADGMGGSKVRRASRCTIILTAEASVETQGILSRTVSLPTLRKGEVIDSVREFFGPIADAGVTRAFYGAYLSWIARQLDVLGEGGLIRKARAYKESLYARHGQDRATDVVGGLAAGWGFLFEFAREYGFEGQLPPQAQVLQAMAGMIAGGQQVNEGAGLGPVVVDIITDALAAGKAKLLAPNTGAPEAGLAEQTGWRYDRDHHCYTSRTGDDLGYISAADGDGERLILISRGGLKEVWKRSGRPENFSQVAATLAEGLTVPRYRQVARPRLAGLGQINGFVFDPETLGIEMRPEELTKATQALPGAPGDIVLPGLAMPFEVDMASEEL